MKFRCERDPLVDAITNASRGVTNRGGSRRALDGLALRLSGDHLQVTGTDLSLTVSVRTSVTGDRDGMVVIPSRLLTEIVKALPSGAVTVESDDNEVRIGSGRSKFAVRTIPAAEFPQLPEPPSGSMSLDAATLADALRQVVAAASNDEQRPVLTGVLMAAENDGLRLVATDSYRLAVRDLPGVAVLADGQSVLVPSLALKELARLLAGADSVTIRLGDTDVSFEVGNVRLTSQLLDGDFPNYKGLIPQSHPNRLTVGREAINEALRRVRLLAKDHQAIRLAITDDSVELVATSPDVGEAREEVDARHDGDALTVAFNPEYLAAGIEVTGGDEITLETIDALKPAIIRGSDNPEFLYLLMPIRVP